MAAPAYVERFGMRTVPQLIRNPHDRADLRNDVEEYLDIVIGTDAMPEPDWVRAKVYWWLADLFYFDRLLQLPLALLEAAYDISVRTGIEHLAASRRPAVRVVVDGLTAHPRDPAGRSEYVSEPAWGGLLWPADQHALVGLVLEERLHAFYEALFRVPGAGRGGMLVLSHDVAGHHAAWVAGDPVPLEERLTAYALETPASTVDAWLEHLVWCYGKDKRAHLGTARPSGPRGRVAVAS